MKILLISDTHGSLYRVGEILKRLPDTDMIFHCGDYQKDAEELQDIFGTPTVSVRGNSDGCHERDIQVVETPAGRILLTHGHMEIVQLDYDRLLYLAEENQCIAACFGHTHRAVCEKTDGIWVVNPGSLSEPRDGTDGTCAVLLAEEDGLQVEIIHYDKLCADSEDFAQGDDTDHRPGSGSAAKTGKHKATGGFLRNLFNYSDRF